MQRGKYRDAKTLLRQKKPEGKGKGKVERKELCPWNKN